MIASTLGITLLVFARQWTHKTLALGAFALYFSGLLLTQSRGYWLAFLVSAGFLFLNVDRPVRRRMIAYAAGGSLILLVLGFVFLQDYMTLVFGGLIERLLSLKTAASVDISLVNRFRESAAVWDKIVHNPVLGYGMGVSYDFFDITRGTTDTDAFVHNGYLSLWYKYGLLGLVLMVYIWIVSIRNGIRAYRIRPAAPSVRLAGLITASALTAFLLSCNTSNPFFLNDTLFAFALLMGTANGASDRVLKEVD
jgi:O-antigen ligase